jgi:hypothetical protein
MSPALTALSVHHRRRLRQMWRSAGWPHQDTIEIELLAAGLLERLRDEAGRETLRVTDAGIAVLADSLQKNRRAFDAHEALVARVVLEQQRAGRIAWTGLSLRAQVSDAEHPKGQRWVMAMPDVYSVRHTTVAGYLQPVVHEIKVRRADLLGDLKRAHKRAAYLHMAGACWYVLAEGVGDERDVPEECGVMLALVDRFEILRAAPTRGLPFEAGLPFAAWMALARAAPAAWPDSLDMQAELGQDPKTDTEIDAD